MPLNSVHPAKDVQKNGSLNHVEGEIMKRHPLTSIAMPADMDMPVFVKRWCCTSMRIFTKVAIRKRFMGSGLAFTHFSWPSSPFFHYGRSPVSSNHYHLYSLSSRRMSGSSLSGRHVSPMFFAGYEDSASGGSAPRSLDSQPSCRMLVYKRCHTFVFCCDCDLTWKIILYTLSR